MIEEEMFNFMRVSEVKGGKTSENCDVFVMGTSDPNYSIFVIDLKNSSELLNTHFQDDFIKELHLILAQVNDGSHSANDLWLPCFRAKRKNTLACLKAYGNVVMEGQKDKVISQVI